MNALRLVARLCRLLLLGLLAIFWVATLYEFVKRGPDGFLRWFYQTAYQNTLYFPPKQEWRSVVIVLSVYFAVTAGLAVWEWRSSRHARRD